MKNTSWYSLLKARPHKYDLRIFMQLTKIGTQCTQVRMNMPRTNKTFCTYQKKCKVIPPDPVQMKQALQYSDDPEWTKAQNKELGKLEQEVVGIGQPLSQLMLKFCHAPWCTTTNGRVKERHSRGIQDVKFVEI